MLHCVVLGDVVERDEHLVAGVLDEGGQRALPAHVLAAEGQPPAVQPAGAAQRRVRSPQGHLPRVHVAAVGGVERPWPQGRGRDPPGRAPACGTMARVTRIGIIGGGPGGYEAALVAAQLGAEVTVVDRDGLGGSAVLTDCVPSKTLIATAEVMTDTAESGELGVLVGAPDGRLARRARSASTWPGQRPGHGARARAVRRHRRPAGRARACGCCAGSGRLDGPTRVVADDRSPAERDASRSTRSWWPPVRTRGCCPTPSPTASGSSPGSSSTRSPTLPEHLVVVGSGVTGAEFASAYTALGSEVTLVSSRDRVLPGEDADAATVLEDVFRRRGMTRAVQVPGRGGAPRRATGVRRLARRRPHGRGQPLPDGGRLDPEHGRARPRGGRGPARRRRVHRGGPGLAHVGDRRLRGRRLHRRAHARVGRGDAGPDRDVAPARRRGRPR